MRYFMRDVWSAALGGWMLRGGMEHDSVWRVVVGVLALAVRADAEDAVAR